MRTLGIDMGTTSISAVVLADGVVMASRTVAGPGFLPGESWERAQDAEKAYQTANTLIHDLCAAYGPIDAIGLTGQMHGIIPLDGQGRAIGPLYTWQDGRGDLPENGATLSQRLSEELNMPMATGYGLVTHVWNRQHGLHRDAASLCTMGCYVAMRLTGRKTPLLHTSDAASLGGFDLRTSAWTKEAMSLAVGALPPVTPCICCVGETAEGIPVTVSLGDNQASFLGAVGDLSDAVLVNVGTGGQVSVMSPNPVQSDAFDTRPYIDRLYLLVNSTLCAGRAYAMLERFLRECAELAGVHDVSPLYEAMNRAALTGDRGGLQVDTRFAGTRRNPGLRGSIAGIGTDNLEPQKLIRATIEGMAQELLEGYQAMQPALAVPPKRLIASGNGARLNPALVKVLGEVFHLPVSLCPWQEEAAFGAAVAATKINT